MMFTIQRPLISKNSTATNTAATKKGEKKRKKKTCLLVVNERNGLTAAGDDARDDDGVRISRSRRRGLFLAAAMATVGTSFFTSKAGVDAKASEEEEGFKSPLIERLLKQTDENKEMNKLRLETKYCLRQAEMGVGDCADIDRETVLDIQKKRAEKFLIKK